MDYTGERIIVGSKECSKDSDIYKEHIERYKFASKYVQGKKVLDLASGTGYGTHLLSQKASDIWGGDIDQAAIALAKEKYSGENVHFRVMDVTDIPFENATFDQVISFETIEHIDDYKKYLAEINRVLKPGGDLILSTPDRAVTKRLGIENPYHVHEFYKKEITDLLSQNFSLELYGQRPAAKMSLKQKAIQQSYFAVKRLGLNKILGKFISKTNSEKIGSTIQGLASDFQIKKIDNNHDCLYLIILCRKNI